MSLANLVAKKSLFKLTPALLSAKRYLFYLYRYK